VLVGSHEDSYVPAYSALVRYAGEDEVTSEMALRLSKGMSRAVRVAVKMEYS
jgi:plasmid maintenance system antidote protein VapI